MLSKAVLEALRGAVGDVNLLTDDESLVCYSFDATRFRSLPDAVARPATSEEVARVVGIALEEGIPVVPRGAGTGLSGGSVPACGGIVVSTERMNSPARIHKEDLYAEVQPGAITGDFQDQVEARGLFYPPDPASRSACTIGGNVAECAGGLTGLKYGTTKNYVLGLELVTPEGKIIRTGARTVKSVAGYDVTRLMVGSEGTLGIMTSIVLKLLPLPQARTAMAAQFSDVRTACEVVSEIMAAGLMPCVLELIGKKALKAVAAHTGRSLGDGVLLLIEFDGMASTCRESASQALEILERKSMDRVKQELGPAQREELWEARRSVLPALTRLAPTLILEDVTVPRSKLPDIAETIDGIASRYALDVAIFGHAGDGNLHPAFLVKGDVREQMKAVEAAVSEMMRAAIDLGGTISGEHGIGLDRKPYIDLEIGRSAYEIMKRLKSSLDPKGIMNPGKMFNDE
jgi:glycolate oxidase